VRIAIVNRYSRIIGGVESYLDCVIPALARAGHELAFIYEADDSAGYAPIRLPQDAPRWRIAGNRTATLAALRAWRPELLYVHGLDELCDEAALLGIAPSVFFAHSYSGTCVSGEKTHKFPAARPCGRTFGRRCLALYYPRHCGGINPRTMMRRYTYESARLKLLARYDAIVTASEHMRAEYARHGLSSVYKIGLPLSAREPDSPRSECMNELRRDPKIRAWRLLFAGRMMPLKGGATLLKALPHVAAVLERPIQLVFAGDGPARQNWQSRARVIMRRYSAIQAGFVGWVSRESLAALYRDSDLLVIPSLWPEPFGLSGVEAGLYGVPAVGFAVGGIPEWLHDGINGRLAPADPPTPAGLARAIIAALCDPAEHQRLREGASRIAGEMTISAHLGELNRVFSHVGVPRTSRMGSGGTNLHSGVSGGCGVATISLK
jgi:glycosyltransferase involved in cell wall biosynthesis